MNKQIEALKMAIEIFTKYRSDYFHMTFGERWEKLDNAIDLIKEALEQPAQEPVAFIEVEHGIPMFVSFAKGYKPNADGFIPLYTNHANGIGVKDGQTL